MYVCMYVCTLHRRQIFSLRCIQIRFQSFFCGASARIQVMASTVLNTLMPFIFLLPVFSSGWTVGFDFDLWAVRLVAGSRDIHLLAEVSWFPCAQKQMLKWFPTFQVATTCFSCSPPDLNLVATNFMFCIYVKQPLPPGDNPIAVTKYYNRSVLRHSASKCSF